MVVQSADPELAKLFFDVFGTFSEVRTIPKNLSTEGNKNLGENGTLIILKKQPIRIINTNFRIENYSSAIRTCPLGGGSSMPLRFEDIELMVKESAYFQSRNRFKIDKMEIYFSTSEQNALTGIGFISGLF